MIDIQPDSPQPVHEQIAEQIRTHVAGDVLKAGARLAEYRALAQQLLTNPQSVARAYAELKAEGILVETTAGEMEVTSGAALACRQRLQEAARRQIRRAVIEAVAVGLPDSDIARAVEQALTAVKVAPPAAAQSSRAIQNPAHASSHRASECIQDLSRQGRPRPA